MLIFIAACLLSISISFLCSLAEAVFYAVPLSFLETMRKSGSKSGLLLFNMRMAPGKPIAAILTLNTVANTAGAAVASASFTNIFGVFWLPLFASLFTVVILLFSEILPKTIGVTHAKTIAPFLAAPLNIMIKTLHPLIWLCNLPVKFFKLRPKNHSHASSDDITALLSLGLRAGTIKPDEEQTIVNVLSLAHKNARSIMTPRNVVFSLPDTLSLEEAAQKHGFAHFTRIPVYSNDPENIIGLADNRNILMALLEGRRQEQVAALVEEAQFIPDTLPLDRLLAKLLESRVHLFIVIDEYGGFSGVVSLEDVLEEILGKEIVEKTDIVANLQDLAKGRRPPTGE